jgi:phosphoserine phosphatase
MRQNKHYGVKSTVALSLEARSLARLVDDVSSPLLGARIHPDAAELLEARAMENGPAEGYVVRIATANPDLPAEEVAAALRSHFAAETEQAERVHREHRRNGLKTLAVSLLVVAALLAGAESLHALGELRVYRLLSESLVIIAWVTMWIPVESLIFGSLSRRRRLARLRGLSRSQVEIVPTAGCSRGTL